MAPAGAPEQARPDDDDDEGALDEGDANDPANQPTVAGKNDRFHSFAELRSANEEGVHYRVTALDRKADVLVLSVHGGHLEPPTDEMARQMAGEDLNLYTFEALAPKRKLHLTSTRFDDPRALDLAARSRLCVSLHGYRDKERRGVCIGGTNPALRNAMEAAFERFDGTILTHNLCKRYPATAPENIANKCGDGGVQLELSSKLRRELRKNPERLRSLSAMLREAALSVR